MTIEELREKLKPIASKPMRSDAEGFNVYEDSAGNYDDAYTMGVEDGEIGFARRVLEVIGE